MKLLTMFISVVMLAAPTLFHGKDILHEKCSTEGVRKCDQDKVSVMDCRNGKWAFVQQCTKPRQHCAEHPEPKCLPE
jgi:hypothetical protein